MQCNRSTLNCAQVAALLLLAALGAQAKSLAANQAAEEQVSAVIPSPNQDFGDSADEIYRRGPQQLEQTEQEAGASNEASVPVYVSPFVRSERSLSAPSFDPQESSHAPLNYAPRPSASIHAPAAAPQTRDLKTSASYGHHHGHHGGYEHHGYDHSGWLDMGAWTGGKGSFGWYADYPVGGKHGYHGRK